MTNTSKARWSLTPYNPLLSVYHTPCPTHAHTHWEVVLFTEGVSVNKVNDTVFEDVRMGDVFVLGPPHLHELRTTQPHTHYDVYCDDETMRGICAEIHPDLYESLCTGVVRFTLPHNELQHFIKDLKRIDTLSFPIPSPEQPAYPLLRAFTNNLIRYLLSSYQVSSLEKDYTLPNWLMDFVYALQLPENFSKRIHEIVASSHYSHQQLSRIFKKYFHCSLIEYVTTLRLAHAVTLLTTTDFSLLQIANELGYANHTILTKKFKERFGLPPIQYRKQWHKRH